MAVKTIQIADKPTLDATKALLEDKEVGLAAIKQAISSGTVSGLQIEKCVDEQVAGAVSVSTLPYGFSNGCAVVLSNMIHILGGGGDGKSHYKFNGKSWTSVSTLSNPLFFGCAVVLNKEIHILGGQYSTLHYKYDGTSWTSVSTLPYEFTYGCAVVLNNEIHILGGNNANKTNHYKYDGTSWTSVSTLPYEFTGGSAVVLNNEIHILGGSSTNKTNHYKFNGTSWESISTLPYEFTGGSAVVLNNEIHILGGANKANHYKFNGTSWESIYILPYKFYHGAAVVLGSKIHILGGDLGIAGASTDHYTIKPEYRYISAIIPKGVHILLPNIQKIIDASDNVTIESSNAAYVTETGYVKITTELSEFDEAYNRCLTFYW